MTTADSTRNDEAPAFDEATATVGEQTEEVMAAVKQRLAPIDVWIRTQASERPLLMLVAAAGVGYLVGRLLRRV